MIGECNKCGHEELLNEKSICWDCDQMYTHLTDAEIKAEARWNYEMDRRNQRLIVRMNFYRNTDALYPIWNRKDNAWDEDCLPF